MFKTTINSILSASFALLACTNPLYAMKYKVLGVEETAPEILLVQLEENTDVQTLCIKFRLKKEDLLRRNLKMQTDELVKGETIKVPMHKSKYKIIHHIAEEGQKLSDLTDLYPTAYGSDIIRLNQINSSTTFTQGQLIVVAFSDEKKKYLEKENIEFEEPTQKPLRTASVREFGFPEDAKGIIHKDYFIKHLNEKQKKLLTEALKQGGGEAVFINGEKQRLSVISGEEVWTKKCSTSRYGFGATEGSNQTVYGIFRFGCSFKYNETTFYDQNKLVTRGIDPGVFFDSRNSGRYAYVCYTFLPLIESLNGQCTNVGRRKIGIHGTNRESYLGGVASSGCIRLSKEGIKFVYDFYCTKGGEIKAGKVPVVAVASSERGHYK